MIENPATSRIWNVPVMVGVARLSGADWGTLDMCQYGMRDPSSKLFYKKPMSLLHNFPDGTIIPVFKRCNQGHQHEPVEGSSKGHGHRSALSQV